MKLKDIAEGGGGLRGGASADVAAGLDSCVKKLELLRDVAAGVDSLHLFPSASSTMFVSLFGYIGPALRCRTWSAAQCFLCANASHDGP